MNYFFLLSKENIPLAQEEVLALNNNSRHKRQDNILTTSFDKSLFYRLGYSKSIYELLFFCKKKDLLELMKTFNWQKHYKKSFRLKLHHFTYLKEKEVADFIYKKLKNPLVDLKNPSTSFEIFLVKNSCFAGKLIYENTENYMSRRAHLRPEPHPTSMHPKLARALINLTGIKKGILYDVFCGSGGILIESGLMKISCMGYDTDKVMLQRAKKNLQHYKIKNFKLKKQDATLIKHKIKYLTSDLPYSRGTKKTNLQELYTKFFNNLQKVLIDKAVIMMPHFVNYKKILKKTKLKILKEFSIYVHKGLTRKIVVLK